MSQPDRLPTPADRDELRDLISTTMQLAASPMPSAFLGRESDWYRQWAAVLLSTLDKAGVVYGPAEPTPKMLVSAGTVNNYADDTGTADADHIAWYRDVLAASPYAPTTPAEPAAAE